MLTDTGIRDAVASGLLLIEPLAPESLQPASYDLRVGAQAFVSGSDAVVDVATAGVVVVEPGEFAVVTTLETVRCGPRIAGQIGLCSAYARDGLVMLSGPQVDPGFSGVLVVRLTNLSARRVTLAHGAPFVTVQFFRLSRPVARPYRGPRQGQTGLRPSDIRDLTDPHGLTLGGVARSLAALAKDVATLGKDVATLKMDVAELKTSVRWIAWTVPIVVGVGMAVVGAVVALG